VTDEPHVIRLAGPRRTSALGLAMLGLEEAIYGPNEAEVGRRLLMMRARPPDPKVKVTLGDNPGESTVVVRMNKAPIDKGSD